MHFQDDEISATPRAVALQLRHGVGMLEHGLLLQLQPQWTAQVLQAFALGRAMIS